MIIRILLELEGDTFSPKEFIKNCKSSAYVKFYTHEKGDYTDTSKRETFDFGSLSIVNPNIYGEENNMQDYQTWYVKFIEANYDIMLNNGLTKISLFWDVFFSDQCNFEIFDNLILSKLSRYNVSIPISIYKLSSHQIKDMLDTKFI